MTRNGLSPIDSGHRAVNEDANGTRMYLQVVLRLVTAKKAIKAGCQLGATRQST